MNRKRKHLVWIVLILVVLAGALLGSTASPAQTSAAASSTPTTAATGSAEQSDQVSADISATGSLRSSQTASLSWSASGEISNVLVSKGDQVEKNQILAEIDPSSNISWSNLQVELQSAQEDLASLKDVTVEQASAKANLIAAQIAVTDAQNSLDALNTPPSQAAIDAWKVVYLKDQDKVSQAQDNYDYWVAYEYLPHCQTSQQSGGHPGGGPGGGAPGGGTTGKACNSLSETDLRIQQANALSALSTAQQKEQKDLAYLTYLQNYQPDAGLLAQAQTNLTIAQQKLVVAQANYDAVKDGPSEGQIAAAEANIASIQAELDKRFLRAPFAGTITDLAIKAGDLVENGTYALRIDDLSSLFIDMKVSEVDIDHVSLGQTVELMFDAVPDKQYSALVSNINPIGTVSGGVSTFTVTAVLQDGDSSLKPGMTAGASIIVSVESSPVGLLNEWTTTNAESSQANSGARAG